MRPCARAVIGSIVPGLGSTTLTYTVPVHRIILYIVYYIVYIILTILLIIVLLYYDACMAPYTFETVNCI